MEVDYSATWLALKANLVEGERSRGRDEVLATMARLEVEQALPGDQAGFDDRPPVAADRDHYRSGQRSRRPSGMSS